MVFRDNFPPGFTDHPNENFLNGDDEAIMTTLGSSDSEDDFVYGRYNMLPQDLEESNEPLEDSDSQESSESEEFEDGNGEYGPSAVNNVEECRFDEATKSEVSELWNSASNRLTDIEMDPNKVEQIKTAMAGFKLPSTAIPSWAKQIPEEDWKQQLVNKFNSMNKDSV